jgi:hypothetical protein
MRRFMQVACAALVVGLAFLATQDSVLARGARGSSGGRGSMVSRHSGSFRYSSFRGGRSFSHSYRHHEHRNYSWYSGYRGYRGSYGYGRGYGYGYGRHGYGYGRYYGHRYSWYNYRRYMPSYGSSGSSDYTPATASDNDSSDEDE